MKQLAPLAALAAALAFSTSAQAEGLYAGLGYAAVNPKSDTGLIAGGSSSVDTDESLNAILGYRFGENDAFAIEITGAVADYEHVLTIDGVGPAAAVEHRPITANVLYRFGEGEFRPYVGGGYSVVDISVTGIGALTGAPLTADNGDGFTVTGGIDWQITDNLFLRADARYIDWSSEVFLVDPVAGPASVGTADVNPIVYGLAVGLNF